MIQLERRTWKPDGRELNPVPCNLCGGEAGDPLAVENGLPVMRCLGCGLVYVTPQPSTSELENFYAEYFPEESEASWRRLMERFARLDAERITRAFPRPCRLLEVGPGFGHFLALMQARGWQVEGLEASPTAAKRLEERGIPVRLGSSPHAELPEARYDVVVASSVLEHVADPKGVLAQIHRSLRRDGMVLIRVPNIDLLSLFFRLGQFEKIPLVRSALRVVRREIMDEENLFSVIDPPAHLFGFTQATLRAFLESQGFRRVEIVGERMPVRGNILNAFIDGAVYHAAGLALRASRGRIQLSPNLTAIARR